MMAKKPHDRYQSADEVAQKLSDWLADRGHEVGDSGKNLAGSGGVGSDMFRRFAQSIRSGDSGGKVLPTKSGSKLLPAPKAGTADEEIGLAPLEEEKTKQVETFLPPPVTKPEDIVRASLSDPQPLKPRKSLVEEALELEAQKDPFKPKPRTLPGEFDPLRPPGYTGPNYGPPVWVYVVSILGVVVVLGTMVAIFAF
jgi:hypothetical protein